MSPLLQLASLATLILLVVAMALALARVLRGPSAQDRVLALDYLYVVAMLVMLVLGLRSGGTMYFEAALIIALFGYVSTAVLGKFLLRGEIIE
ncbi:MAG: K+/H+ antiporter subunit F [Burkholderiaceae bacterium]|nr:K+/H+ antiporter subunit F [Burkholderiaceae bacterium]MCD6672896.1 K+/H+ antiporter subunit F [Burkholderiaceae bacterium]